MRVGDIHGDSTDAIHRDWIDVEGYSIGAVGGPPAPDGTLGRASVQELVILYRIDRSLPKLLLAAASGRHLPEGLLSVCPPGYDPRTCAMEFRLSDVVVRYVSIGADRAVVAFQFDRLRESLRLIDPVTGQQRQAIEIDLDLRTGGLGISEGSRQKAPAGPRPGDDVFALVRGIAGDSVDAGHLGWIDAQGMALTASTPVDDSVGGSGIFKVQFDPVAVDKRLDSASPLLLEAAAARQSIADLEIQVCARPSDVNPAQWCHTRIVLTGVGISSVSTGGAKESLGARFGAIEVTYQKDAHSSPVTATWDVAANTGA